MSKWYARFGFSPVRQPIRESFYPADLNQAFGLRQNKIVLHWRRRGNFYFYPMSFLHHLESVGKKTGSFNIVESYLKDWQKIIGLLGFLALLVFILAPLFMEYFFRRKKAEWEIIAVLVLGMAFLRLLSSKLLGAYKITGTLCFEDDRLVLTNRDGEILASADYDEIRLIRRQVGVPLTGLKHSKPVTAHVLIVLKGRPPLEFETEWNSSVKRSAGIEEVIGELREFKKLDF
jgi:hypothetical protein